jgi:predicted O-methyltransferase YrrM
VPAPAFQPHAFVAFPPGDYVSPNLQRIRPDAAFPYMVIGDTSKCDYQYLRRQVPHNWYVDSRMPLVGFVSRDEAHLLYNMALKFQGRAALEIGCWLGWSACHLALGGVKLDVVDPILAENDFRQSVTQSLSAAGILHQVNLTAGSSPMAISELSGYGLHKRKWSLIFIDGNHGDPGPLQDAVVCEERAEDDAMVIFHDLVSPDVARGLEFFQAMGWKTRIYQTMQIVGVAYRGNVTPLEHVPDPMVNWDFPDHLKRFV